MGFLAGVADLQPLDGVLEARQHVPVEAIAGARSFHFPFDHAGCFELFEVLADGGLRQRQDLHEFTANAAVDGPAGTAC